MVLFYEVIDYHFSPHFPLPFSGLRHHINHPLFPLQREEATSLNVTYPLPANTPEAPISWR